MSYLDGSVLFLITFLIFSVSASVIDIRHKRIPDWIVFSGVTVLLALRFFSFEDPPGRLVLEMLLGPMIFLGIRLLTKGKLGMGDVKFAALMAVFVGFPGWFIAAGLASLLGLIFALPGIVFGSLNESSRIPFAPFLTVGSIGAYFVNCSILLTF